MNLIDIVRKAKRRLVFPGSSESGINITGYRVTDCLFNKKAKLDSILAYAEKFNPDIIFNIGGIAEEAECFGARLNYSDDEDPSVSEPLVKTKKDVDKLIIPSAQQGKLTSVSLEVIPELRKKIRGRLIAASVTGPFTLAALLAGAERFSLSLEKERGFAVALLEKCTIFLETYAQKQLSLGANYFTVAEPSAIFLSEKDFDIFCLPFLKKLFKKFKEYPSHIHICGDSSHLLRPLSICGADGLSLDSMVNLEDAARFLPSHIVLIGNIDPVSVISEGGCRKVRVETEKLLSKMELFENFILATACSIPLNTPLENISAFIDAGKNFKIFDSGKRSALKKCADSVLQGNSMTSLKTVKCALKLGLSPEEIYSKGLARGVKWSADNYNSHRASIPQVLLSVESMEKTINRLWSGEKRLGKKRKETILIGTVKGDIHEIGKNLVSLMFESKGYRVIDAGVDVSPETFVEICRKNRILAVGLSSFTTAGKQYIKKTAMKLKKHLKNKSPVILAGGPSIRREDVQKLGIDGYGADMVEAVEELERLLRK